MFPTTNADPEWIPVQGADPSAEDVNSEQATPPWPGWAYTVQQAWRKGIANVPAGWPRSVGFALTAAAVGLSGGLAWASAVRRPTSPARPFSSRRETAVLDICPGVPHLQLGQVLHSNLGYRGPDTDTVEGLAFRGFAYSGRGGFRFGQEDPRSAAVAGGTWREEVPRSVELRINARSPYQPSAPRENGFSKVGDFGIIVLSQGSNVTLTFSTYDPETKERLQLDNISFTFFDIDKGPGNSMQEQITFSGFHKLTLTNNSETLIQREVGGGMTFIASGVGDGDDNPTDPARLTPLQRRRTISAEFKDFTETNITLAVGQGPLPRYFSFLPEPSFSCGAPRDRGPKHSDSEPADLIFYRGPQATTD
jgi:hypothetical protein